jgi:hypothetical protein
VRAALQIITDEDWAENEELQNAWIRVLEASVCQMAPAFVSDVVIEVIKELMAHKNTFAKRKLGSKMFFSVAKHTGEQFFDKDDRIVKLILQVCHDGNYKIRRDGVIFLREYFAHDRQRIINHSRFREVYVPELFEFLNDEDTLIKVDAIETFCEILEELKE